MPEQRMAAVAGAFAVGILAASHLSLVLCIAAAGAAALIAGAAVRDVRRGTALVVAAVFALGAARYASALRIAPDDISRFADQVLALEGVVASDPERVDDRVRLVLRVERAQVLSEWREASGSVMVNIYAEQAGPVTSLEYGDRARIGTTPYKPSGPSNPGQFSWKDYLARQGIHACASVREAQQVQLLPGRGGNVITAAALSAKHYLAECIRRVHHGEQSSLIVGIVLGTYSYLPPEVFRSFSSTGTLHILAASGYNCFVLLLIATPVLKALRVLPKWRSVVVIALITAYLLMVGPKPSLVRASIMAALLLMALPLRRAANVRNLFFTAGLIVLALRPADLYDVGFQLSFLSVWALIVVTPVIESVLVFFRVKAPDSAPRQSLLGKVLAWPAATAASAAVGTVAITIVTAPVVAYHFNYVSLVSVPANMAVAVGVPIVFAVGFASGAAVHAAVPGTLVGAAGDLVTRGMLAVVDCFGSMRHAAISVASPGVIAIAGYYLIVYAVLSYARGRCDRG